MKTGMTLCACGDIHPNPGPIEIGSRFSQRLAARRALTSAEVGGIACTACGAPTHPGTPCNPFRSSQTSSSSVHRSSLRTSLQRSDDTDDTTSSRASSEQTAPRRSKTPASNPFAEIEKQQEEQQQALQRQLDEANEARIKRRSQTFGLTLKCPICRLFSTKDAHSLGLHLNSHPLEARMALPSAALDSIRTRRCACGTCMADTLANLRKHTCTGDTKKRASIAQPQPDHHVKRSKPMPRGRRWQQSEFLNARPSTRRAVTKPEFASWRETVMREVLRGYAQASAEDRVNRLLRMTEVVRNNAPWQAKHALTEPQEDQNWISRAKKVKALVSMNAMRKACRVLTQGGKPVQVTDEVIADLQKLHPDEPQVSIPPEWTMTKVVFCTETVKTVVLKRLAKGAAGGMDGWTRELLVPIVTREESLREFTAMILDVANGDLLQPNQDITERLFACPLIALTKEGQAGGLRPIAIESCLIKVAAHAALTTIAPAVWKDIFPSIQYGAGPMANVESAVLATRAALAGKSGISIDCANAFNTIKRDTIMTAMKSNPGLAPIYRLTALSLLHTKICVTQNSSTIAILESRSGVRQGSVLGPILFCVGLQPTLSRIARTTSSLLYAYMDDITVINSRFIEGQQTIDALVAQLKLIGLAVNINKSFSMFSTSTFTLLGQDLHNEPSIAKCLGAAMYQPDSTDPTLVKDWVTNRMMKMDSFFSALSQCPLSATHALALLRICANGRPNFLLRTHPGSYTLEGAQWFDERVEVALKRYIGEDIDETALSIYRLPCNKGGLGLRSQTELVDVAHNAALTVLESGINNLQQQEVCQQIDALLEDQLRSSISVDDRRHLDNAQGCSVASLPMNISDDVYKYFIRSRGLLQTTPRNTRCKCGTMVLSQDHLYRCDAAPRERIARHDVVKRIIASAAERRFSTRIEPVVCDDVSKKRPDLIILTAEGEVAVDVAVIFSGSTSPHAAATKKHQKYKYISDTGSTFIPFIVSHCGVFHDECEDLFRLVTPSLEERAELKQSIIFAILNWNFKICRALCPPQAEVTEIIEEGLSPEQEGHPLGAI